MRSGQRGIVAAVAAAALLVAAAPAAASAGTGQAGADREARGQIRWTACKEDATAECGVLRVPVDWRKPRGATFDLALARRKAADPARRIGSLVINPGGPGGSGVDFALGAAGYFTPEIMAKFDVVGLDPRGVARSHAVRCSTDLLAKAPSPELTSQADFDRLVAYNAELGKDCRAHTGPLYDHVDTGAVIQDIDAVRKALGERRISYYGVSYGTLIGQQYAERFPKNFRALVIDSNMDHSLHTRAFLMTETVTGEANFNEFVKWCARDTRCAVRDPGASQVWKELLARADRGELPDPEDPTRKLTAWDLTSAIFGAFYGPDWKGIADAMAALRDGTPLPAAKKLLATRGAGVAKAAAVARGCGGDRGVSGRGVLRGLAVPGSRLPGDRSPVGAGEAVGAAHADVADRLGCRLGMPRVRGSGEQPAAPPVGARRGADPHDQRAVRPGYRLQLGHQCGPAARAGGDAGHLRGLGPRRLRARRVLHGGDRSVPGGPDRAEARDPVSGCAAGV